MLGRQRAVADRDARTASGSTAALRDGADGGAAHLHPLLRPRRGRRGDRAPGATRATSTADRVCDRRSACGCRAGRATAASPGPATASAPASITNPLDARRQRRDEPRHLPEARRASDFERMPGARRQLPRRAARSARPTRAGSRARSTSPRDAEPSALRTTPGRVAARAPLTVDRAPSRARRRRVDGRGRSPSGSDGTVLRYEPGQGWTREFLLSLGGRGVAAALRGVAWPEPDRAHAVGDLGAMWLWRAARPACGSATPARRSASRRNLMDVAFAPGDPDRGYAVGTRRRRCFATARAGPRSRCRPASASRLHPDRLRRARRRSSPPATDLLVNDGGGWRVDAAAPRAAALGPPGTPRLFAVAGAAGRRRGRRRRERRDRARRRPARPGASRDQPLPGSTVVAAGRVPRGRPRARGRLGRARRRTLSAGRRPAASRTRTSAAARCRRSRCPATATCCARPPPAGATSSTPRSPARALDRPSSPTRSSTSRSTRTATAGRSAAGAASRTAPGAARPAQQPDRHGRPRSASQTGGVYRYGDDGAPPPAHGVGSPCRSRRRPVRLRGRRPRPVRGSRARTSRRRASRPTATLAAALAQGGGARARSRTARGCCSTPAGG